MELTSSAFGTDEPIPNRYTCDGENINPPLTIGSAPNKAKSLVLIMEDPDTSMGTWTHWTVWDIPPDTTDIAENSLPDGSVEGTTSAGHPGYVGPCPPSGKHRYFFKLFALGTKLTLDPTINKSDLEAAMAGHILDQAELMGTYERQK